MHRPLADLKLPLPHLNILYLATLSHPLLSSPSSRFAFHLHKAQRKQLLSLQYLVVVTPSRSHTSLSNAGCLFILGWRVT